MSRDDLALAADAWRRRPVVLGGLTVLGLALVALGGAPGVLVPALVVLVRAGVTLAAVDVATLRLPDVMVGALTLALLVALVPVAVVAGPGAAGRSILVAATSFVLHLVLALINPAGLGMGDVKLAVPLGLVLGALGWRAAVLGVVGAFVLVAVTGLVLLAVRRAGRSTALPFGPFMLTATVLVAVGVSGSATG